MNQNKYLRTNNQENNPNAQNPFKHIAYMPKTQENKQIQQYKQDVIISKKPKQTHQEYWESVVRTLYL
ncbi:hypothetical protein KO361_01420 [Candidatus Woesearchaeota archaeon]|nr:hypothetical protein [Candidatus Woesearchaeota archaeon]